jgi:hypothetical protein
VKTNRYKTNIMKKQINKYSSCLYIRETIYVALALVMLAFSSLQAGAQSTCPATFGESCGPELMHWGGFYCSGWIAGVNHRGIQIVENDGIAQPDREGSAEYLCCNGQWIGPLDGPECRYTPPPPTNSCAEGVVSWTGADGSTCHDKLPETSYGTSRTAEDITSVTASPATGSARFICEDLGGDSGVWSDPIDPICSEGPRPDGEPTPAEIAADMNDRNLTGAQISVELQGMNLTISDQKAVLSLVNISSDELGSVFVDLDFTADDISDVLQVKYLPPDELGQVLTDLGLTPEESGIILSALGLNSTDLGTVLLTQDYTPDELATVLDGQNMPPSTLGAVLGAMGLPTSDVNDTLIIMNLTDAEKTRTIAGIGLSPSALQSVLSGQGMTEQEFTESLTIQGYTLAEINDVLNGNPLSEDTSGTLQDFRELTNDIQTSVQDLNTQLTELGFDPDAVAAVTTDAQVVDGDTAGAAHSSLFDSMLSGMDIITAVALRDPRHYFKMDALGLPLPTTLIMRHWMTSLMWMSKQFSVIMMQQMQIVGMFFDAKHELEIQMLMEKLSTQVYRDFNPDQEICVFGTNVRSLAASERRAKTNALKFNEFMLSRETLNAHVGSSFGPEQDKKDRFILFTERYCDVNDSNNNFMPKQGSNRPPICQTNSDPDNLNTDRFNNDIDYPRMIESKLTLNLDMLDGAGNTTPEEEDIIALSKNLFAHTVSNPIRPSLLMKMEGHREILEDIRSVTAMRGIARNSFSHLIGMRSAGTAGSSDFIRAIFSQLGVPDDELDEFVGANPSYFAQMEVLTKKLYQHPDFYANLYTQPANVDRSGVALQAFQLMQDRDRFEASLRREMLISMLLETQIRDLQDRVNGNFLERVGGVAPSPQPPPPPIPPANCLGSPVVWSANGNTCDSSVSAANHGSIITPVNDGNAPTTGTASFTCDNGSWILNPGATCWRECNSESKSWPDPANTCTGDNPLPITAHNDNATANDTIGSTTGSATYTCDNGNWTGPSGETCVAECPTGSQTWVDDTGGDTSVLCDGNITAIGQNGDIATPSANAPNTGNAQFQCNDGNWTLMPGAVCVPPPPPPTYCWEHSSGAPGYECNDNGACTTQGSTISTTCYIPGSPPSLDPGHTLVCEDDSTANCVSPLPDINGQCGNANGQTLTSPPTNPDLCDAGIPTAVTDGAGTWIWTCQGIGNGNDAPCSSIKNLLCPAQLITWTNPFDPTQSCTSFAVSVPDGMWLRLEDKIGPYTGYASFDCIGGVWNTTPNLARGPVICDINCQSAFVSWTANGNRCCGWTAARAPTYASGAIDPGAGGASFMCTGGAWETTPEPTPAPTCLTDDQTCPPP